MIQYWPYQQGIDLNTEVATLFSITKHKLSNNLLNTTSQYLYIDILDNQNKYHFFCFALQELELLILEIIEFNLTSKEIKHTNYKILCNLIIKIYNKFFTIIKENLKKNNILELINNNPELIEIEHQLLLENLIIYLVFGSSHITNNLFAFKNYYTPKKHINILLENFIIQINNITFFYIFETFKSLPKLIEVFNKYKLCNQMYLSNRSLSFLKNNLIWQKIIDYYLNQPKNIYNSRYQVWLISNKGLTTKYIYTSRIKDIQKLNHNKSLFLILIEIQDLIIPKIEKIFTTLSKITLYVVINIIGNSIIFLTKTIIYHLNKKNRID
uniref:Ycf55 n=1 Tax=Antithamnionella ternifolia TaxID=207919 RepID=A0A4D6WNZ1_9FLOR|nr:hypothetical protein [Antithamnionella ternifolia]